MRKLLLILLAAALSTAAASPTFSDVEKGIRSNDLGHLRQLVSSEEAANVADGLGVTALHYAALYGSPEAIEWLLHQAADPNARSQSGATPLVYAAWNLERTKPLIEHGAAINVRTKHGVTPLIVASGAHGNLATVRLLLDLGADVHAETEDGEDALMRAASFGDADVVKLLLERGADPKRADRSGSTALQGATTFPDAARVRLLLRAGSDPNSFNTFGGMVKNGPLALVHLTPLMTTVPFGDQDAVDCLLKAGARVNETDIRKMTPLMLSIATDHAQPETVRKLLAAGADVHAKDIYGDSALDWARKFGNPDIISLLVEAKATGRSSATSMETAALAGSADPEVSIGKAMSLFAKSDFFRAGGGCAGCHHQPAYARAYSAVRAANLTTIDPGHDSRLNKTFLDSLMAIRPRLAPALPLLSTFGGDIDVILTMTSAESDLNEPPSEFSDMMIHFLAARQDPSGAWFNLGIARPPIEESTITRTAYAIRALKRYSWPARQVEFDERIRRAAHWLQQARPETTYEHADRILGLETAGVPRAALRPDGDRLLTLQRADGGWAQSRFLQSDAYATGMVLDVLFRTGLLQANDPAYRRGVSFLLHTQFADGSWYVRSRAPKFQPYFQSGFPFDHDQWISSAGSAWAVMALSHAAASMLSAAR